MSAPTEHDFGRELDELRHERGLSFEELARRSGVSATYLKDLAHERRGHGWPSPAIVASIARALDVKPDHFRITRARAILARPKVIDTVYERLSRAS